MRILNLMKSRKILTRNYHFKRYCSYPCLGEVAFKPLRLVRDILDKGELSSWGAECVADRAIAPR